MFTDQQYQQFHTAKSELETINSLKLPLNKFYDKFVSGVSEDYVENDNRFFLFAEEDNLTKKQEKELQENKGSTNDLSTLIEEQLNYLACILERHEKLSQEIYNNYLKNK